MPTCDAVLALISADVEIDGNVSSAGDIQIDGRVTGDIKSSSATIGEGGMVTGNVNCERVTVHGALNGNITAQVVALGATARVRGEISYLERLQRGLQRQAQGRCGNLTWPMPVQT